MAGSSLGVGKRALVRARPYDVFVVGMTRVLGEGAAERSECHVSHELRLSHAVVKARAWAKSNEGKRPAVEVWLEGLVNVFAAGHAEVGFCGDEPCFPVSPGRYRWTGVEGSETWSRLGAG